MALTKNERDRIIEEETLRNEIRSEVGNISNEKGSMIKEVDDILIYLFNLIFVGSFRILLGAGIFFGILYASGLIIGLI